MFGPKKIAPPYRTNISYYHKKYEILDLMFRENTSSFKLVNTTKRKELYDNLSGEFFDSTKSNLTKKLIELNEIDKLNSGETLMVFETSKGVEDFLASDFSMKMNRYSRINFESYILIHNYDKTSVVLYSLEEFNKVMGEVSKANLTIIFDNTYFHYEEYINKNKELHGLIYGEKNNIEFFFLYGEKQI